MKVSEFEEKFDSGEDISSLLDLSSAKRPDLEMKRIEVDFPEWMIEALDQEALRIGTTRQSLIKFWLVDKLDHQRKH